MVETFIKIDKDNIYILEQFLLKAGEALDTFRYFKSRPVSIVYNHLYTTIYMHNSQPVGYGHLDPENNIVWLGIAVIDAFQGKGIGKKIMNHLIKKGNELKLNSIRLSVDKVNLHAIKLYEKIGFVKHSETNNTLFYKIDL